MRLRHIEVFNAVMLTGSVSAAGRLINVTQPAVSRALQHAELQLGFSLFQRVGGRLVPTEEARTLYPHIERLFAQLDEVQKLSASLRTGRGKHDLRVLTLLALSYDVFPRAVRLFHEKYPDVVIHHEALHSPQIVSALATQQADVGYVFGGGNHPALTQEKLGQGQVMCVVPKGLLAPALVKSGSVSFAQLAGLPLIALDASDPLGFSLGHIMREGGAQLREVVHVQSYHVALSLAHQGLGIALVESCTTASADRGRVDLVALAPTVTVTVRALRPATRPNSLQTRMFTRCMQRALPAPP